MERELAKTDAPALDQEMTPDVLRASIEREVELRKILLDYFRSQMVEGYHFYRLPESVSRLPSLSKAGALNLCSLFKLRPAPDPPNILSHEDGHYTVIMRVHLINRRGEVVATGDAARSTRESKYAYRWVWPSELPPGVNKEALEYRLVETRKGMVKKYKIPNPNPADDLNTVIKMADKSATVGAALKLPLVSELFTQDVEEHVETDSQPEPKPEAPAPKEETYFDPVLEDIRAARDRLGWSKNDLANFAEQLFGKRKGFTRDELMILREKLLAMAKDPLVQKAVEQFEGKVVIEEEKDGEDKE